jgi:hypothetical protein
MEARKTLQQRSGRSAAGPVTARALEQLVTAKAR